jgi:hypothetical protein
MISREFEQACRNGIFGRDKATPAHGIATRRSRSGVLRDFLKPLPSQARFGRGRPQCCCDVGDCNLSFLLGEYRPHHVAVDVRQTVIAAGMTVRQLFVVEPQ